MTDIQKVGLLRANPEALDTNTLRVAQCDAADACEDKVEDEAVASGDTLVSFVYEGDTYTLDDPVEVDDPSKIQAALQAIIEDYEVDPIINVDWASDVLDVRHVGGGTLSTLTFNSAGAVSLTRTCTTRVECEHTFFTTGDDGKILAVTQDGTEQTYTFSGNAYTGTSGTDATTAGTLKTGIESAIDDVTATVTVNDVTEGFDILLLTDQTAEVLLDEEDPNRCCCKKVFWSAG